MSELIVDRGRGRVAAMLTNVQSSSIPRSLAQGLIPLRHPEP